MAIKDVDILHQMTSLRMLYSVTLILIFKVKHFLVKHFLYKIVLTVDPSGKFSLTRMAFAVELLSLKSFVNYILYILEVEMSFRAGF